MVAPLTSAYTRFGREQFASNCYLGRHRHRTGYIAVVLGGAYLEAGDDGRRRVQAGDVLVHGAFEAHTNSMSSLGADVLNLPLLAGAALPAAGNVADPDAIARIAERSVDEALVHLANVIEPELSGGRSEDWPDRLAAALSSNPRLRICEWGANNGLAPASISRGFHKAFGVGAAGYRAEAQARRAWNAITQTSSPLVEIADEAGFADQAHMTRAVSRLTGRPAGHWRQRRLSPVPANLRIAFNSLSAGWTHLE